MQVDYIVMINTKAKSTTYDGSIVFIPTINYASAFVLMLSLSVTHSLIQNIDLF